MAFQIPAYINIISGLVVEVHEDVLVYSLYYIAQNSVFIIIIIRIRSAFNLNHMAPV